LRRRLYFQVYLGSLIIALLCAELTAVVLVYTEPLWRGGATPNASAIFYLRDVLKEQSEDSEAAQARVEEIARQFSLDAAVWSGKGEQIASVGRALPRPNRREWHRPDPTRARWLGTPERPTLVLPTRDGGWIVIAQSERRASFQRVQVFLGIALLAVALGSLPMARRVTRRIERLKRGVDGLGSGDLSSRVPVEGNDEVADLAHSFNRAAERIEGLVKAQRLMLASASHELRTPLTRIRVGVELLGEQDRARRSGTGEATRKKLISDLESDIEELDGLIGDLLLTGRVGPVGRVDRLEEVEVLALLAQEASRFAVEATGQPVTITGEPGSLHRMVRNLLDNARRYGAGSPVEASVQPLPGEAGGARLVIADRGRGVPEEDRDRIFEPFYRPTSHSRLPRAGAGIGLALVREIARYHGGEARCLAREGGGTRFEVDLRGAERILPGQEGS
jgi:signal transduction histidine kinase